MWGSCRLVVLLVILTMALSQCHGGPPSPTDSETSSLDEPSGDALLYDDGEEIDVTAKSLRARSEPSTQGAVVGSFKRGDRATVIQRSGEWMEVAKGAERVWISASHVKAARSTMPAAIADAPPAAERRTETSSSTSFFFGKRCKHGQPCGNSCISWSRTCHK